MKILRLVLVVGVPKGRLFEHCNGFVTSIKNEHSKMLEDLPNRVGRRHVVSRERVNVDSERNCVSETVWAKLSDASAVDTINTAMIVLAYRLCLLPNSRQVEP